MFSVSLFYLIGYFEAIFRREKLVSVFRCYRDGSIKTGDRWEGARIKNRELQPFLIASAATCVH